jgi:hypothetical protein
MTESELPAFMISVDGFDTEALLEFWRWLVPRSATPLFISVFGDWVFGVPDGSLWALSLLEGDFRKIADSSSEYNRLKSSFEWMDQTFMAGWQEIAHRHGLTPRADQCIGWRIHPTLGGPFKPDNLQLFDMLAYQCIMGQLHESLQPGR